MTTDDKIRNGKLQYDTNREAAKVSIYHLENLINMNILEVMKYCLLTKDRL